MKIKITSKYKEVKPFTIECHESCVVYYPESKEIERVVLGTHIHGISKFKDDVFILEEIK